MDIETSYRRSKSYRSRWSGSRSYHRTTITKLDRRILAEESARKSPIPIPSRARYPEAFESLVSLSSSNPSPNDEEYFRLRLVQDSLDDGNINLLSPETILMVEKWRGEMARSRLAFQCKITRFTSVLVKDVVAFSALLPLYPDLLAIGVGSLIPSDFMPLIQGLYSNLRSYRIPITFSVIMTLHRSSTGTVGKLLQNQFIVRGMVVALYGALPATALTGTATYILGFFAKQLLIQSIAKFGETIDSLDLESGLSAYELQQQVMLAAIAEKRRRLDAIKNIKENIVTTNSSFRGLLAGVSLTSITGLYLLSKYWQWGIPPRQDRFAEGFVKEAPFLQRFLTDSHPTLKPFLSAGFPIIYQVCFYLVNMAQSYSEYTYIYPWLQSYYRKLGLDKKVATGLRSLLPESAVIGKLKLERIVSRWFRREIVFEFTYETIANSLVQTLATTLPIASYTRLAPERWMENLLKSTESWTFYLQAISEGNVNKLMRVYSSEVNELLPGTPLYMYSSRVEAYAMASNSEGVVMLLPRTEEFSKEMVDRLKDRATTILNNESTSPVETIGGRMGFLSYSEVNTRFGVMRLKDGSKFDPNSVLLWHSLTESQQTAYDQIDKSSIDWQRFKTFNDEYIRRNNLLKYNEEILKENSAKIRAYNANLVSATNGSENIVRFIQTANVKDLDRLQSVLRLVPEEDYIRARGEVSWYEVTLDRITGTKDVESIRKLLMKGFEVSDRKFIDTLTQYNKDSNSMKANREKMEYLNSLRTSIISRLVLKERDVVIPSVSVIPEIHEIKAVGAERVVPVYSREVVSSSTLKADIAFQQVLETPLDVVTATPQAYQLTLGEAMANRLSSWSKVVSDGINFSLDTNMSIDIPTNELQNIEKSDLQAKCFTEDYKWNGTTTDPPGYEDCVIDPACVILYRAFMAVTSKFSFFGYLSNIAIESSIVVSLDVTAKNSSTGSLSYDLSKFLLSIICSAQIGNLFSPITYGICSAIGSTKVKIGYNELGIDSLPLIKLAAKLAGNPMGIRWVDLKPLLSGDTAKSLLIGTYGNSHLRRMWEDTLEKRKDKVLETIESWFEK